MSQIITFYSYKGGVGRSMALANVATLLSKWGKKVLMIDWDLEAPGLENFFKEPLKTTNWSKQRGVLDLLYAKQQKKKANWQDWVLSFKTEISKEPLNLLISGKRNGDYADKLRDFNVSKFYDEFDGGNIIEAFRTELLEAYDYVLIDSRTGVTDFGGICTIQLPDILVMLFTPTDQGLLGTKRTAERILENHQKLPFDRYRLLIYPVPSRFDATTEFKESRDWLKRSGEELGPIYEEWLPIDIDINEFLENIKIPYISYFSFGEKLPVVEQGVSDPAGLGYAYENAAMLLSNMLENIDLFMKKREAYLIKAGGSSEIKNKEITLTDYIRKVNIYISYPTEDTSLIESLTDTLLSKLGNDKVEFIHGSSFSLGESRKLSTKMNLERSDMNIFFISNNNFKNTKAATGVSLLQEFRNELDVVRYTNPSILIPIYYNLKRINKNLLPSILKDRIGLEVTGGASKLNEAVSIEILPIVEKLIKQKSKMNLFL
ncbi:MAG: ParA family protein [Lewinellaceae bacterium]|nr:ParA family protein [Lewinellaceae bacterium]